MNKRLQIIHEKILNRKLVPAGDLIRAEQDIREQTAKRIFDEIYYLIEKYFIEKPDDYDADINDFLEEIVKLKKKFLKGKNE